MLPEFACAALRDGRVVSRTDTPSGTANRSATSRDAQPSGVPPSEAQGRPEDATAAVSTRTAPADGQAHGTAEPAPSRPPQVVGGSGSVDGGRTPVLGSPALWFALAAAVALVAHAVPLTRVGLPVATLGEARLAASVAIARGAEVVADPLSLSDRFAALQLALLETVLPVAGLPAVEAARWACLVFGAVTALLLWPALRGLKIAAPAAAVGVALLGAAPPVLALHAGISAAAPAATWLTLAVVLAVRGRMRTALAVGVLAVLTAPLAAAAVLAVAAHVVFDRTVRPSDKYRLEIGGALVAAAATVAGASVATGPLAGVGPDIGTIATAVGVAGGLVVVLLAYRHAAWLRPVLTVAALLLLVGLVPGPSRATAALLVAPGLAVAVAVTAERVGDRLARFGAVVLVALLVPVPIVPATPVPPSEPSLVAWLTTEPAPGVPIRADALDRTELAAAGVDAQRLRSPADPATPDELLLVADRPVGGLPPPARRMPARGGVGHHLAGQWRVARIGLPSGRVGADRGGTRVGAGLPGAVRRLALRECIDAPGTRGGRRAARRQRRPPVDAAARGHDHRPRDRGRGLPGRSARHVRRPSAPGRAHRHRRRGTRDLRTAAHLARRAAGPVLAERGPPARSGSARRLPLPLPSGLLPD